MDLNLWTLAKTSALLREEVMGRIHVLVYNVIVHVFAREGVLD